jgi:hypothetical protein
MCRIVPPPMTVIISALSSGSAGNLLVSLQDVRVQPD